MTTQVLLSINSTGVCSWLFHSHGTGEQTDTGAALLIMEALTTLPCSSPDVVVCYLR